MKKDCNSLRNFLRLTYKQHLRSGTREIIFLNFSKTFHNFQEPTSGLSVLGRQVLHHQLLLLKLRFEAGGGISLSLVSHLNDFISIASPARCLPTRRRDFPESQLVFQLFFSFPKIKLNSTSLWHIQNTQALIVLCAREQGKN